MAIPTPPDCTNTSEVRVATCETTQDLQEFLTKTIADGLTTNYGAKSAATLISEAFSNYLQTQVSVKYVWAYDWADATARNAETGMVSGEYGHQIDTDEVYQYNGVSWVLVTVAVGEQAYNTVTFEVLKYASSWDLFYAVANQNEINTNTNSRLSVVVNVASDADITLTTTQNEYGRIEITDTGVLLTTARNVIMNDTERTFLFVNSTAQDLTVKNATGTGITVLASEAKELRNDTTNVIEFEAQVEPSDIRLNTADELYSGQVAGEVILKQDGGWIKNQLVGMCVINGGVTPTFDDEINFASITRSSAGIYNLTFSVNMDNINYTITEGRNRNNGVGEGITEYYNKSVSGFTVKFSNPTSTEQDPVEISLNVFGGRA